MIFTLCKLSCNRGTPLQSTPLLRFRNCVGVASLCPSWRTVVQVAQRFETLGVGHYTRRCSVITSDSDCASAIVCCFESEVFGSKHSRDLWVLDLQTDLLSSWGTVRTRTSMSLSQEKIFLLQLRSLLLSYPIPDITCGS